MRRYRESGSPAPARFGGYRRPMLAPYEALVRSILEAKSDISLVEMRAELHRHGIVVGDLHDRPLSATSRPDAQKEPESFRAGSSGRGAGAPALAGLAALHGPEPLCLPG
jgi:hypothetical protein